MTFNNKHVPADGSLDIAVFQKFMKRLRKSISPTLIRFYACGEYGDNFGRPHYHACVFGYDFPDKKPWQQRNGEMLYRSALLERAWPFGYSSVGTVTFNSAAYVARYIVKKINGDPAKAHYEWVNPETGEITQRNPEYTNMSRRPGIGSTWLDKFLSDVYPEDFVVMKNKKMKPPKFYDARYELCSPEEYKKLKRKRKADGLKHEMDNTPERLKVKETVQQHQLKQLKREIK